MKAQFFQDFDEDYDLQTIESSVTVPSMEPRDNCEYWYGVAQRGFCGLNIHYQDEISRNLDKSFKYATLAKFIKEEKSDEDEPFYYVLCANCGKNDNFRH